MDNSEKQQAINRLLEILRRHVRERDNELSDEALVQSVIARWYKYLDEQIVDVGE